MRYNFLYELFPRFKKRVLAFIEDSLSKVEASKIFQVSKRTFFVDSGKKDYFGAFAVTAGIGIEPWVKMYEAQHDDYNAIMTKALADRLAEAMAEYLHEKVRKGIWGYSKGEQLPNEALIDEKYQGIRPAPGYPACPDHTEKDILWRLLNAEANTGIILTESKAMYPAASVSGWYIGHPESKYFGLGNI